MKREADLSRKIIRVDQESDERTQDCFDDIVTVCNQIKNEMLQIKSENIDKLSKEVVGKISADFNSLKEAIDTLEDPRQVCKEEINKKLASIHILIDKEQDKKESNKETADNQIIKKPVEEVDFNE